MLRKIINIFLISAIFSMFFVFPEKKAHADECGDLAAQVGQKMSQVVVDLKALYDDFNSKSKGRSYYNDSATDWGIGAINTNTLGALQAASPKTLTDWIPIVYAFKFVTNLATVDTSVELKNYFNANGVLVVQNILKNYNAAADLIAQMQSKNCGENTQINIKKFGDPKLTNQTTLGDINAGMGKLDKILNQIKDQQSTTTTSNYNPNTCQQKCNDESPGLGVFKLVKEGYCAMMCILTDALTAWLNFCINMLYYAAGVQ